MIRNKVEKIGALLSLKVIAIIGAMSFGCSLLPVLYLSFFNRASGDDYGYGALTHQTWQATHSFVDVLLAAGQTVKLYYYSWQGTWSSIFAFSLQPEVFHDQAYVFTAFLMLFLWIGSTILLFHYLLVKRLHFSKYSAMLMELIVLIISIQFIPSTKSAIFWFNGAAHYMFPFSMCQVLIYSTLRFSESFQKRQFCFIILIMLLMGGSNYQAALFSLLVVIGVMVGKILWSKCTKLLWLLLPIVTNLCGLFVSMKAPGNKVRGGEEFGFSFSRVIETIGESLYLGIKDIWDCLLQKPLVFVGLVLLFVISVEAWKNTDVIYRIPHSAYILFCAWTVYFAMQTPAAYADVEVSRGVINTNFQVFLIVAFITIVVLSEKLAKLKVLRDMSFSVYHAFITLPTFLLCFALLLLLRGDIKKTTTWRCMEYISSGQAVDYRNQMLLQTDLLNDETVMDVVVPFINDEQGPFMHMPVTDDVNAWTNKVTKEFYGRNSVVAMPRTEWEDIYLK